MGIDGLCAESVDISGRDDSLFGPLVDKDLSGISGINRRTVNSKPPPEVKHIIPFPCRHPGIPASIVNYFHLSVLAETNTERMARCFVFHLWYAGIPIYSDRYPAFLAPVIETLQLSRRHVYLQEISLSPSNFLLCTGYHKPRSLFRF